ncbi:4Fe-4S binding protein [candidate division KSB1 bacterium]|nr:4Fe-4S binding protein [candidate division KSB1 bacterium]MBL7095512.1 4Fe-4S binding protein [candidate division KSB1 bacterium]
MFGLTYLKDVSTLDLDLGKCTGCRMCTIVCPHAVFTMENKKAKIVNKDWCMECGACALNCADGAITVNSGVGCAAAIIQGAIKGTEPCCDCGSGSQKETVLAVESCFV